MDVVIRGSRTTFKGVLVAAALFPAALFPSSVGAGVSIDVSGASVAEGNSGATPLPFGIARSGDLGSRVVMECQSADGSAVSPADYASIPLTEITLAPGADSGGVAGSVHGDTTPETDESFVLMLAEAAAIGPDPTFGAVTQFPVSNALTGSHRPHSAQLADFNGDGRLDIVVANSDSNDLAVLLNVTGAGASVPSFSSPTMFSTGINPGDVRVADVNGDGKRDVIYLNYGTVATLTNTISVRLNTTSPGSATPTFSSQADVFTASQNTCNVFDIGDMNGDGRVDIVSHCPQPTILRNTTPVGATTPSFIEAGTVDMGASTKVAILLVDLNQDGRPDIASTAVSGTVYFSPNQTSPGSATAIFGPVTNITFDGSTAKAVASDFDGDGRADLAVAINKTMQPPDPLPSRIAIALNGSSSGGAISFPSSRTHPLTDFDRFLDMVVDDINGDARPDILSASNIDVSSGCSGGAFQLHINSTPPGSTVSRLQQKTEVFHCGNYGFVEGPVTGDLNGDGKKDVVIINSDGEKILVLLNNTVFGNDAPSFATAVGFAAGSIPSSVSAEDFNGDGKPDLVVANNGSNDVSVLLGATVTGTLVADFTASTTFAVGAGPTSVASGDMNGDGIPDLAVANRDEDSVTVLMNTTAPGAPAAAFSTGTSVAVGDGPTSTALQDLNGDGVADLVVANGNGNTVSARVNGTAPGATTPTFGNATSMAVGTNPRSVATADLNGDGRPDVAVANQGSNTISILLNTTAPGAPSASFAAAVGFATGASPIAVALGDINGDGKRDLAVASSSSNAVSVLINGTAAGATTPSFGTAISVPVGTGPETVALRDVNDDGRLDLIVGNRTAGSVSVLLNTTAPGSTSASFSAIGAIAANDPAAVDAVDLNGDGQRDLVVASAGSNQVTVVFNTLYTVSLLNSQATGTILDDDTDGVPAPFHFTDQTGVATSTLIASDAVTLSGMNSAAMITVSGGEYSIDGGTFTTVAGSVSNGQSVTVRHTSAASANTATNTTLTVGGVSDTFTSITAGSGGADTTPDPFTFADQPNAQTSTVLVSNAITVTGISASTAISVTGGEYSVDGAMFTSSAGTVNAGQSVRVRHTSAATPSTSTETTLTIGGVSGTFSSVTAPPDTQPTPFHFTDATGVALATTIVSDAILVAGINEAAPISVSGGEYSIDGGGFTEAAGTVAAGQSVRVRHESASTAGTSTNTTLTIGGVGDTFSSTTKQASRSGGGGGGAWSTTDLAAVLLLAFARLLAVRRRLGRVQARR